MTKVNNFHTFALHNSTHNVYGSIMPIKQTGSSYNTDVVFGRKTHNIYFDFAAKK
jgi:hypothetical protein